MVARINTVAFSGIDVQNVDVQVQISSGLPAFHIVGLPDKAVAESRERVRAALHALGISLPSKRLTVNLAPADLSKEGSHFDLPIALGLLAAMDVISREDMCEYVVLGELSLDAGIRRVSGVLPAAIHASSMGNRLICPKDCGSEAAWAGEIDIVAASNLLQVINHMKGNQVLSPPVPSLSSDNDNVSSSGCDAGIVDLASVKGQESAKRALEIAAAGGHNMLMIGPPGSGKSMLASCLPGILPPLSPEEALEVSMIHSISGTLPEGGLMTIRPYREPHHSASLPAIVGGGQRAKPGEISLAHHGVLFLDELPEFSRNTLEALRQPLETGKTLVARANAHISYPADFQLIAAMNPCRCGYLGDEGRECTKAPRCGLDYQAKISGPLLDRIDLHVEVPAVAVSDLGRDDGESSADVAKRVLAARKIQNDRCGFVNARASVKELEEIAVLESSAKDLLNLAADKMKLSARSYYRVLRVARTIADLDAGEGKIPEKLTRIHVSEALGYRQRGFCG